MSIDETTVAKVAKLARIALPEDRLAPMTAELNNSACPPGRSR